MPTITYPNYVMRSRLYLSLFASPELPTAHFLGLNTSSTELKLNEDWFVLVIEETRTYSFRVSLISRVWQAWLKTTGWPQKCATKRPGLRPDILTRAFLISRGRPDIFSKNIRGSQWIESYWVRYLRVSAPKFFSIKWHLQRVSPGLTLKILRV